MPLNVLLIFVVGGISAIAVLLHVLGKSRLSELSDDAARIAWNRHFPGDTVLNVLVAQDGHAALVETDQGAGLLWSFGADTVGRYLQGYRLSERAGHLRIVFADFSAPAVSLTLSDHERPNWQQRLAAT